MSQQNILEDNIWQNEHQHVKEGEFITKLHLQQICVSLPLKAENIEYLIINQRNCHLFFGWLYNGKENNQ